MYVHVYMCIHHLSDPVYFYLHAYFYLIHEINNKIPYLAVVPEDAKEREGHAVERRPGRQDQQCDHQLCVCVRVIVSVV